MELKIQRDWLAEMAEQVSKEHNVAALTSEETKAPEGPHPHPVGE